jgi:hypothetical protein
MEMRKLGFTISIYNRSRSSHMLLYHVQQHKYSNRGKTPSVTTHITRSNINTPMFSRGKTPTGNIHGPSQRDHLEQFINAKEKDYREILQ